MNIQALTADTLGKISDALLAAQASGLQKSITTATLTACPHCEVPPPRVSSGTPKARHTPTVATMSSIDFGNTTPTGTWR